MAKTPLTPERIGQPQTEHAQQCAVFAWAALNRVKHPALRWMHAIPNGGERDRVVAGRMKAEGVRAGVSDICLPSPRGNYHGLYVELKLASRKDSTEWGGCQDNQIAFIKDMREEGYAAFVAYGWEHAVRIIEGYLGLGPYRA